MKARAGFLLLALAFAVGIPATAQTPTTAPTPAPTWTPPSPLPAKPNWTWIMNDGTTYNNVKVIAVDPENVTIVYEGGGTKIPLATLPGDIQTQLHYSPPPSSNPLPASHPSSAFDPAPTLTFPPKFTPNSVIGRMVSGNLVALRNGAEQPVDDSAIGPVKYFAIYYSAQWCHSCRAFTPDLVKFYNDFKPTHPNFELIFVSEDNDPAAMLAYMKDVSMPGLAVRYDALIHPDGSSSPNGQPINTFKSTTGIESFADIGIPDLVLVDSTGKVLSDSWKNGKYIWPEKVLSDIKAMVQ